MNILGTCISVNMFDCQNTSSEIAGSLGIHFNFIRNRSEVFNKLSKVSLYIILKKNPFRVSMRMFLFILEVFFSHFSSLGLNNFEVSAGACLMSIIH